MSEVLYDGIVETSYGQLDLVWSDEGGFDGDHEVFFAGQVNGVAGAARSRRDPAHDQ